MILNGFKILISELSCICKYRVMKISHILVIICMKFQKKVFWKGYTLFFNLKINKIFFIFKTNFRLFSYPFLISQLRQK